MEVDGVDVKADSSSDAIDGSYPTANTDSDVAAGCDWSPEIIDKLDAVAWMLWQATAQTQ